MPSPRDDVRPAREQAAHLEGRNRLSNWNRRGIVIGACCVMLVYWTTLAPTFYNLDSAEFCIGVATLGIVHAPGYPLYLLSSKLLTSLLPGSDLGYKMNVLSALYATLSILNVIWICHQIDDRDDEYYAVWGGAIAGLMLAFSFYFWASAVVAEVYTFQIWLFSLAIGCLVAWDRTNSPRWLVFFGLTYGLCYANHMSIALTVPGVLWYFACRRRRLIDARAILPWMALALLVGPAMYVYFPLRYQVTSFNLAGYYGVGGQFTPIDLGTLNEVFWMASGQMFRSMAFAYDWPSALVEWGHFARQFWGNFLGAGIVLGCVGIPLLWNGRRCLITSWALMMLLHSVFFVNYRAVDKEMMFLPVYFFWTLLVGVGSTHLLRRAATSGKVGRLVNLLWLLPIIMLVINYTYVDVSWDTRARLNAQSFVDGAAENALVIGWWTEVTPIQYLQHVEGQRPDIQVINRLMISHETLLQLVEQRIDHQPIYLSARDWEMVSLYGTDSTLGDFSLLSRPYGQDD